MGRALMGTATADGREPRGPRRAGGDLLAAARGRVDRGRPRRPDEHHGRRRPDALRGQRGRARSSSRRPIPTPRSSSAASTTSAMARHRQGHRHRDRLRPAGSSATWPRSRTRAASPLTVASKTLRPPFLRGDDSGGFGPNASVAGRLRHPDGAAPADGLDVAFAARGICAPRRAPACGSPRCGSTGRLIPRCAAAPAARTSSLAFGRETVRAASYSSGVALIRGLALPARAVAPLSVGGVELRVPVAPARSCARTLGKTSEKKSALMTKKSTCGMTGIEDADHAEDEEEDREREVAGLAAPAPRRSVAGPSPVRRRP